MRHNRQFEQDAWQAAHCWRARASQLRRYASFNEVKMMARARKWMLLCCLLLAGYTVEPLAQNIPIDQIPMYGGMDRSAYPELKAADEKFIEGVTHEFGSREKASQLYAKYAFDLYLKDDLTRAMARFNQAWLLNPTNPNVFWGFAAVLHDRGDYCQSMELMEKALELGISTARGFLADAGSMTVRCALSSKTMATDEKKRTLEKAEELFLRAEREDPNKAYVYGKWASAYRDQERYVEAWQMVAKQRSVGGKPNERFLSLLRSEFPEPVAK